MNSRCRQSPFLSLLIVSLSAFVCGAIATLFATGCHKAAEPEAVVTSATQLSPGQNAENKVVELQEADTPTTELSAEPPTAEPTAEQLKEVEEAFKRLEAVFLRV